LPRAGCSTKFTVIFRRDHEIFATAQEAEHAFYQAFERADLVAMMAVWAEEDDIVCVHPGGARHTGVVEVRESWRQIFVQGPRLRFRLTGSRVFSGRMLSIHSVYEHVSVAGDPRQANPVLATNIYLLTDRGWRMLMHHGSPIANESAPQENPPPCCIDERLPRAMVAARRASADHLPLFRSEAPPAALPARTLGPRLTATSSIWIGWIRRNRRL